MWRFRRAQHIYHLRDTILDLGLVESCTLTPTEISSNITINSSRLSRPLGCFMTGIFYETTAGPPAPRGQTARQQRSEWMAHFLAVAWCGGYGSSGLFLRGCRWRDTHRANLCVSASNHSASNHCLLALLHVPDTMQVVTSRLTVTTLCRRYSHRSLRGDLFQHNWKR